MFAIKNFENFINFKNGFLGEMSEDFFRQLHDKNLPDVGFIEPNLDAEIYKIFADHLSKYLIKEGKKPSYYNNLGRELYLALKYEDSEYSGYSGITNKYFLSIVFDYEEGFNHCICWCNDHSSKDPTIICCDNCSIHALSGYNPDNSGLIEVVKNKNGDWVEVDL